MSYTVTTTAGTTIATVADGTVNTTSTSLVLIGKNYAGYGIFLNENYVQLLENFSNSTPPAKPLTGQLWYDNVNDILKVYNSVTNQWKPISSSISQGTAPSASVSVTGDIWWDTTNAQLKVWSGSAWITIGPSYTSTSGTSGPVTESILDTNSNPHVVTKFYVSNSVIAILSKDATFSPQTTIPGFSTIIPGMNLISQNTLAGAQFTGTTTGATNLGGYTASDFILKNTPQTTSGQLTLSGGLTVGSDLIFDTSSSTVAIIGPWGTSNKNLRFDVSQSGVTVPALTIAAVTNTSTIANLVVPGSTTIAGLTTSSTILPSGTVDIGTSGNKFGNVYANYLVGTSVQSQYADLAERFAADVPMIPGTVVEIGGIKEITAAVQDLSEKVFGVISTAAGFLMNGGAGSNATHPPVAVNGRVPVRVVGAVNKGDRLVSAGRGLARAADRSEITAFNVIGRALEDKTSTDEGLVEAIVKLNS
jgi:hypothetical protein